MFAFGACADCPHAGFILMMLVFAQAVIGARACEKASVDILCVKMMFEPPMVSRCFMPFHSANYRFGAVKVHSHSVKTE